MNPFMWLLVIIGSVAGVGTTLYIIVSLFAVLAFKIYRTVKHHIPLYD